MVPEGSPQRPPVFWQSQPYLFPCHFRNDRSDVSFIAEEFAADAAPATKFFDGEQVFHFGEEFGNFGRNVPPALSHLLERYRAIYEKYEPADARYLENHRGHLMVLRPEEHEICTADLIRMLTVTGTKAALQDRIRALAAMGYTHFAVNIRHGHPSMLEDWAEVFAGV